MRIDRSHTPGNSQTGFSLIEIIVVLLLVGTIGSIGTLGLATFIKNFQLSQQATGSTSAGQMAMLRITKELISLTELNNTETNSSALRFTSIHEGSPRYLKVELVGSELYLNKYSDNTTATKDSSDLLVDGVDSFQLRFMHWDSSNATSQNLSTPSATPPVPCPTAFSISSFEDKYCDDDGGVNRQKIRFKPSHANYSAPYILYYGGVEYYFCLKDGKYRASDNATDTGDCDSNGWADNIKLDIPYYDTIYIYPRSNPECYISSSFPQQSGDECTNIGSSGDNPAPSSSGGNQPPLGRHLIQVILTMDGISQPFTVLVSPRNL